MVALRLRPMETAIRRAWINCQSVVSCTSSFFSGGGAGGAAGGIGAVSMSVAVGNSREGPYWVWAAFEARMRSGDYRYRHLKSATESAAREPWGYSGPW